ncbi:hypothetical protein H671_2g7763 [Cricetulus griseus]|nr:hypothetical protein H671_2g7763 [Cricetulus griseus]
MRLCRTVDGCSCGEKGPPLPCWQSFCYIPGKLYFEEHLGCFQVLAITNDAAMNMIEQMPLLYECASFGYMHKSGIVVSCARTSMTILKRYGESGQSCLVPDFRRITLSFSPFTFMLAVDLLYIAFIMFSLKSNLLDIRIATPACFLGPFDWKIFSQTFTLRFGVLIIMYQGNFFLLSSLFGVVYVPVIPDLSRAFVMKVCLILSKAFSASSERVM